MNQSKWLIRVSPLKNEAGMALILVLLLLLLVSAIGLGMVFMANTESSVNANYRDTQLAFFAMRGGLDEARDRIRLNSPWPTVPPTTLPGTPNSIIYIINPAAGEVIDPKSPLNLFFDDELCHEYFPGMGLPNPGANIPCTVGPPAGSVAPFVNSISPNTGTASALKFKWARITLKQNATFAAPNGALDPAKYVDPAQPIAGATSQVCYQSLSGNEVVLNAIPGGAAYGNCANALNAGVDAGPVYVVTALAITPNGSRRMGQYEVATLNVSAPPVALGMDGPAAIYNPVASSNVLFMDGRDDGNGYPNPPGCASTGNTVPAITVGDNAGVNNVNTALAGPPDRSTHYTGCTNTASPCAIGSPSVVNGGGTTFAGEWSTPSELDNMVNSLANQADNTYTCSINGFPNNGATNPCNPAGSLGTDANPLITYVNGDFNMGNASGAGVLIVTGTLFFNGNANFDGLILVIGQGALNESGGGNGGFNGSVFLAKTRQPNPPFTEYGYPVPGLQPPTIAWNGGGNSFIQYNSCWAKVKNNHVYYPIAAREEMY